MPQINILNILQGDNQSTIVDKINYNFDQILSAGGGPQGQKGVAGPTGAIGPQGPQGVQGAQGPSGTKWFVQNSSPALGNIQGSNPFLFPTIGDYWLDPDSAQQEIYVFGPTGWVDTGFGLAAGDIFQKLFPVPTQGGGTSSSIMMAGNSEDITLVLSDSTVSQYSPGGTSIENLNFEDSKLKISSKDSRTKLISFGHSDFDIDPGGSAGTNSTFNPYFAWVGANPIGANFWDVELVNPTGAIGIQSLGIPASGGINLFANGEISAQSTQENVLLSTAAANKGTFVDASSGAYGFFEVGDSSTGANFSKTFMYVNSTGMGLGIGTGAFKLTGNDSRRLAVLGNVSISKTDANHTTGLFVGTTQSSGNNNKGVLYVEGHAGFGRPNPTGYQGGSLPTIGLPESANVYPQVWMTSPSPGPVLQIRNLGTATSWSRTVIGDGTYDKSYITNVADRVSGTGPDISQEFFSGGATLVDGPLLSFQHKLTNYVPTNIAEGAPVFAITTSVSKGSYDVLTSARDTTIQTRNSNARLIIQANSTGQYNNNRVSLGTAGYSQLAVFPGPVTSATTKEFGTTVIGYKATGGARGLTGTLDSYANFSSAIIPDFGGASGVSGGYNSPSHALSILGTQTIGTTDPVSLLSIAEDGTRDFSAISMLKIHRNLGSINYSLGGNSGITGARFNNWPNGLEITSFRSSYTKGDPASANKSVALAVGATHLMTNGAARTTCEATGFYVSDTGENVAIGATIDYTVALNVSGATAILAKGAVAVTGANFSIVNGDINVSGGGINVTGTEGINVTGGGSISITGSGSLNVGVGGINVTGAGGINVSGGNIDLVSGAAIYVGGTGSINITGIGDINITGSGSINVGKGGINLTGGSIDVSGGSANFFDGATLNVGGTGSINITGPANINVTGTGNINITGGGSLNVSGGGGISVTGPGSLTVATGGINVIGTGGIDMTDGASIDIGGTGGINITGSGSIGISGGGSINVTGGNINVTGGNINITGGIFVTGTTGINVTGSGGINVSGGNIDVINASVKITVGNLEVKDGDIFVTDGGINVTGTTGINVTGSGGINVSGGNIDVLNAGINITGIVGINMTGSGGINTDGGDHYFTNGNLTMNNPGGGAFFNGGPSPTQDFIIGGYNAALQITNVRSSTQDNFISWYFPSLASANYTIPTFSIGLDEAKIEMQNYNNPPKGSPAAPTSNGIAGLYLSDATTNEVIKLKTSAGPVFGPNFSLLAGTGSTGVYGGLAVSSYPGGSDLYLQATNVFIEGSNQTQIDGNKLRLNAPTNFFGGTPVAMMYCGRIRFTKTGVSSGTASVLQGKNAANQPITLDSISSNTTTISATVEFPTPMPSANIIVVCHIDSESSNHYPWTVVNSQRDVNSIRLHCLQQSAAAWSSGSVDASFIAICIG